MRLCWFVADLLCCTHLQCRKNWNGQRNSVKRVNPPFRQLWRKRRRSTLSCELVNLQWLLRLECREVQVMSWLHYANSRTDFNASSCIAPPGIAITHTYCFVCLAVKDEVCWYMLMLLQIYSINERTTIINHSIYPNPSPPLSPSLLFFSTQASMHISHYHWQPRNTQTDFCLHWLGSRVHAQP